MANEKQKQRFSWTGMGVIAVLGLITYFLVQSGKQGLLILYTLATVLVIGLMVAVMFDFGVGKDTQVFTDDELDLPEASAAVVGSTPKVKARKRRR